MGNCWASVTTRQVRAARPVDRLVWVVQVRGAPAARDARRAVATLDAHPASWQWTVQKARSKRVERKMGWSAFCDSFDKLTASVRLALEMQSTCLAVVVFPSPQLSPCATGDTDYVLRNQGFCPRHWPQVVNSKSGAHAGVDLFYVLIPESEMAKVHAAVISPCRARGARFSENCAEE